MSLNLRKIATLFRAELKTVLRDRRVLISSIVLPLLVTPFMFLGTTWSIRHREQGLKQMVYRYAVIGWQPGLARSIVPATVELRNRRENSLSTSAEAKPRTRRLRGPAPTRSLQFEEANCDDAVASLNRGDIQIVVEALPPPGVERDSAAARATKGGREGKQHPEVQNDDTDSEPSVAGVPSVRLLYRADRDESARALSELQDGLEDLRRLQRKKLLQVHGFPVEPIQVAAVTEKDIASQRQVAGLALGRTLTLILLVFILTSGAVVATDSIAGEKERGTLETLLTTAVNRVEILTAKCLVILAIALLITLIQTGNLLLYVGLKLLPVPPNLAAAVSLPVAVLLVFLFLPVAALAAATLLLISGFARSYREAQMYFLPALLIGLVPTLSPFLPGVPLRSVLVLVPIANIALAVKEILIGSFDWPMIVCSWFVTWAAAAWITRSGVRLLSAERLVAVTDSEAAEFSGGVALFERHVFRWYACLWAALLIIGNYLEKADVRVQVTVNLVGLFFGVSCLILWRYRLDPREALALRLPRPYIWLGVLLAVPGGLLTSLGLFRLSNLFLPVSNQMTESFNQNVIPPGVPFWQLLLFLTILPGVMEEIAFRGLLLHGLHKRLRPAAVAVVVGVTFGIFHVALFRFVPTACLGVMFAAVTLLTGSIFPAMLWHCLNNAVGILVYRFQIPENELPMECYLAGAGILAAAFWIFYRNRSPYPGLRGSSRD